MGQGGGSVSVIYHTQVKTCTHQSICGYKSRLASHRLGTADHQWGEINLHQLLKLRSKQLLSQSSQRRVLATRELQRMTRGN